MMGIGYNESYVGQLRKPIGHHLLIVPSVRAVISNEEDKVHFTEVLNDYVQFNGELLLK